MASDLVTLGQIAKRLGVPYNTVYRWYWRSIKDRRAIAIPMPPPLMKVGVKEMGVWEWDTFKEWYDEWRENYQRLMGKRSEEWKEEYRAEATEGIGPDVEGQ